MIKLVRYKVIKSTCNNIKLYYVEKSLIDSFKNNTEFKHDIFNPEENKIFIKNYLIKNKLPLVSEDGEPYVYDFFVRGRSKDMPFKLDKRGKPAPYISLFPGYDNSDNKLPLFPNAVVGW